MGCRLKLPRQTIEKPDSLPHVIWITSGFMAFMPIHAARNYAPGTSRKNRNKIPRENTMSHVISSYFSSINTLAYTRVRKKTVEQRAPNTVLASIINKALVIATPQTPKHSEVEWEDLDVQEEIEAVIESFEDTTVLTWPAQDEVRTGLKSADLIHFACHGITDSSDPSNGGLLLCDQQSNSADILRIRDIVDLKHKHAQIAFLAACSTAEVANLKLADESIHLASAFQLMGFPHVIGTMWRVDDKATGEVAREFYNQLEGSYS